MYIKSQHLGTALKLITTGATDSNGNPLAYQIDDDNFFWDESLGRRPTDEELKKCFEQKELNKTRINRKNNYPPFGEQLDYIYHHGVDAWKTDIVDPIKQKFPKPDTE